MLAQLQAGHVAFMLKVYEACKHAELHCSASLDEHAQVEYTLGVWKLVYQGEQVRSNKDMYLFIKEVHEFYAGGKNDYRSK